MEEANCTEILSLAPLSETAGLVKTQTVSTLLLLRAHPGYPLGAGKTCINTMPFPLATLLFNEHGL